MNLKKVFLYFLALILSYSSYASSGQEDEDSIKSITKEQYIRGGFASIFPGFGMGHHIQERHKKGSIINASESIVLTGYLIYFGYVFLYAGDEEKFVFPKHFNKVSLVFGGLFLGIKIWEIADAWILPSHIKVVKGDSIKLRPLVHYNQNNLNLGLSLQYKF